MMTKEEATQFRDKFARINEKLADTSDEKILAAYGECPEMMAFVLHTKEVFEAIFKKYDLEPEF
jgi:hypothetical protein